MVTTFGLAHISGDTPHGDAGASSYEDDLYAWSSEQAAILRRLAGEMAHHPFDGVNIAEELEGLGESQRSEIESRLLVLIVHLLKWRYQAAHRSSGWRGSIVEQRKRIARRIARSPSLKSYSAEILADEYQTARLKAAGETDLAEDVFPPQSPFTIAEILDDGFYPEGEGDHA